MFRADVFIKQLRKKENLSQRKLAELTGISCRQIQRIEHSRSDITLQKLELILDKFGMELKTSPAEPDWKALAYFGMPLNISGYTGQKYKYNVISRNICMASAFLSENRYNPLYARHYDAFKALILALKTHYPSRLEAIREKYKIYLSAFNLSQIQGRHIKLRNICLPLLVKYFSASASDYSPRE